MIHGKTLWLAANAASGSNSDEALAALDAAFITAGCPIARTIDVPRDGAPTPESLRDGGVDVLAIFTGDGTVNSVIAGLRGWEGAVLVLPGGTMNILAHRLHGAATPAAIIASASTASARRVRPTLVRSRHGDGLSGMLVGPGTAWGEVREAMRDADVLGTLASAAEAIGESTGGAKVYCRAPACGRAEGYSAIQITPVAEGLALHAYYAETLADYAKQGVALLRRNFREGPHDELGTHRSVRLACLEGQALRLLIDGEAIGDAAGTEEAFTLAHCDVDLLATADVG
jgi:hypothetical protein